MQTLETVFLEFLICNSFLKFYLLNICLICAVDLVVCLLFSKR